ncbi:hypothetical protein D3C71_1580570 [compost metagenome]
MSKALALQRYSLGWLKALGAISDTFLPRSVLPYATKIACLGIGRQVPRSYRQCAAVSTHWESIRVPPQNTPSTGLPFAATRATCQGDCQGLTFVLPTASGTVKRDGVGLP